MKTTPRITTLLFLWGSLLAGCSKPETVPYSELLSSLTNLAEIAELDAPSTQIITTYDRTGKNEDYNFFQGKTEDGDIIIADLKGPGVIDRFWFTGIEADRRFRFYFDGEDEPRLDTSWNDLRKNNPPFNAFPVSMDEQNCWHTHLPIPFQKSLLITTEDAGYTYGKRPKFYYHLNWTPLPAGQTVESAQFPMNPEGLTELAKEWRRIPLDDLPAPEKEVTVASMRSGELWSGEGPATLRALTIESDINDPKILRNVILKIFWDDSTSPSVSVPLGDFFGSVWQRWRAESLFFGSNGDTFYTRFPMPFQTSGRIILENRTRNPVQVKAGVDVGPIQEGGYFHANWRNSRENRMGTPHTVLKKEGKGRYVGTILSVMNADRSWWALESDESIYVEGERVWQGTGLEDYFNSGWYYGNVYAAPVHGLPLKAPFRTVQYRVHLMDALPFEESFQIDFERGPDSASRAAFESVAFYYMDTPQPAGSILGDLAPPNDPVQQFTLMTELANFERFGNLAGTVDYIDRYIQRYNPPFTETLELRKQATLVDLGKRSREDFVQSLAGSTNEFAAALRELYSDENKVLIQLFASMDSDLYLNGEKILTADDEKVPVYTVTELQPGTNALAATAVFAGYPRWTQVSVRNADGFIFGTSTNWVHEVNPDGEWSTTTYDDSEWHPLPNYDGRVKGPPEAPHIWVQPDPFVNTLSQVAGLRSSLPWPDKKGVSVFRSTFTKK